MPNTILGTVINSGDIEANSVRFLCSVSSHVMLRNTKAIIGIGTHLTELA